jgi:hypothetical protein
MSFTLIMLGSGIFWTATYLLIIWRGFRDQTYGMPLAAFCANISWEFIFSFIFPSDPIQHIVNIVWFTLDVGILLLFLRYGPKEFKHFPKWAFYTSFALALLTAFSLVLFITIQFHDNNGVYSAFGQNLMMSVLFITMLLSRQSLRGQSLSIAICKLIGTFFASLAFYLYSPLTQQSGLLPCLYIGILIYDLIYVGLVYVYQHKGLSLATK